MGRSWEAIEDRSWAAIEVLSWAVVEVLPIGATSSGRTTTGLHATKQKPR